MFYVKCSYWEKLRDTVVNRERETERDSWREITIEWRIKTERNDSQKINVLQYRHASACQSIPLWLILGGLFLAVRNLEALTRLLLHSSARNKALVCSNWLWIISYWLEFNKINEHNRRYCMCAHPKAWLMPSTKKKKKRQDGKIAIVSRKTTKRKSDCHVRVFFLFQNQYECYFAIIDVSWCRVLE